MLRRLIETELEGEKPKTSKVKLDLNEESGAILTLHWTRVGGSSPQSNSSTSPLRSLAGMENPTQVPPLLCFLISQILFVSLRLPPSTLFYLFPTSSLPADLSLPDQSPNEWDTLPDCVFIVPSLKEHDTLITGQRRQSEFVNRELQRIKKSDHE